VTRIDVSTSNIITVNDTAQKGGYFFFDHDGLGVSI
jgi:hypothetical protein